MNQTSGNSTSRTGPKRAKASIQFQEDVRGFSLLQYASTLGTGNALPGGSDGADQGITVGLEGTSAGTNNPAVIKETSGRLSMDKLAEAIVTLRSKLEQPDKSVNQSLQGKRFHALQPDNCWFRWCWNIRSEYAGADAEKRTSRSACSVLS